MERRLNAAAEEWQDKPAATLQPMENLNISAIKVGSRGSGLDARHDWTPDLGLPNLNAAGLATTFARVFQRLDLKRPMPQFQVEFRPFAGARSTISLRDGRAQVRLSDLLAEAPPIVLEALAEILLARVSGRRPSREARECYKAYVFSPPLRRRIDGARRERGYKRLLRARGRAYDLEMIFHKLNRRFFQSRLSPPRLGWSTKRARTILGHYDSAHRTIIVNRRLDSPSVPRYLIEYLVFHEMLHMRYPVERRGHRRVVHSREFREAEQKFPMYEQARQRLKLICP